MSEMKQGYLNWEDLRRALDYDLEQERAYSYKEKVSLPLCPPVSATLPANVGPTLLESWPTIREQSATQPGTQ
jgi:hypothetical protein